MKTNAMGFAAAVAVLTMLPGCCSSSPPGGRSASAVTGTPEAVANAAPFRVSGVGLMMTPADAAAALMKAGHDLSDKIGESETSTSFEDRVQERLTGKPTAHPTPVPSSQTWKQSQKLVRIDYGLFPGAPRAVHIRWSTDAASPRDVENVSTLENRYGPGWRLRPFLPEIWCNLNPSGPSSATLSPGHAYVELIVPTSLYDGQAGSKRVKAAARARQPGRQGSF